MLQHNTIQNTQDTNLLIKTLALIWMDKIKEWIHQALIVRVGINLVSIKNQRMIKCSSSLLLQVLYVCSLLSWFHSFTYVKWEISVQSRKVWLPKTTILTWVIMQSTEMIRSTSIMMNPSSEEQTKQRVDEYKYW